MMAQTNHIEKVAVVGASGHLGEHFVEELLKTGKHTITAITRNDSKGTLPAGISIIRVNYDEENALVSALRGQQFLIITLSVHAPPDIHGKLVTAAAKAGIPYIMPNTYGYDITDTKMSQQDAYSIDALKRCHEIEKLGASYIALTCGSWFEWSLALGEHAFGFDIKAKKVTFYDDGKTVINASTWRQCGRALAALLSLPIDAKREELALAQWKNQTLFFSSFRVSQRDMLDSIHRVTGSTDKDWEISYEETGQRHRDGLEEMQKGQMTGFAKALYARIFFPNGFGDFESRRGLANEKLGLPKEELDEATARAVKMVEIGWNPFA